MSKYNDFIQIKKFVDHLNYKNNIFYNKKIREKIIKTGILKFVIIPYIYIANISTLYLRFWLKTI